LELDKYAIAERFAALTADKQKVFLETLNERGIDFSQLPIIRQPDADRSTLSYAQQRHWFLWQLDPQSTAYHLSAALRLRGELNVAALQASFRILVQRHESLRTVCRANAHGEAEQVIEGAANDRSERIAAGFAVTTCGAGSTAHRRDSIRSDAEAAATRGGHPCRYAGTPFDRGDAPHHF